MATTYDDRRPAAERADTPRERSVGEHFFIWIAWALAAAFWGAAMTTFFGILDAVSRGPPATVGGGDFGGVAWLIIDVVAGLVLLGAVLAVGAGMSARRNRRLDPAGEAATAALYDDIERQGGEDMTSQSPDDRRTDRRR